VFSRTPPVKKNRVGAYISNVENFCSYSEVNLLHAVHLSYEVFSTPPPSPLKLKYIKGDVLPTTFYEDTLALNGWTGLPSATPWHPWEYPQYPYDRGLGGPEGQSGWVLVKRKSLASSGDRTLDSSACSKSMYYYAISAPNYSLY